MNILPFHMQQQAVSLILKQQLNSTDRLLLQNLLTVLAKDEISQRKSFHISDYQDDSSCDQFYDEIITRRA